MKRVSSILILATILATGGCGSTDDPPNLLLITLDTVRADRLGCYGYQPAQTPNLDRMAAEGILFERAYSPYPLTLPSHATMLSGLLPFEHGIRNNDQIVRADGGKLITEILQENGYRTGAVVSAFVLDAQFGLDRGFTTYVDDLPAAPGQAQQNERSAEATTDLALAWLDAREDGPFFLWVHYFDPHFPYAPPIPFEGDPYDGEIAYMDRHIGRLLEVVAEGTVVLVAGDHGEAFGEHDEQEHGLFVYDTTIQVPLLLRLPRGERAGERVTAPAGLADIAPTLLALAGHREDSFDHAVDLRALREGSAPRPLYAETLSPFFNHSASPLASVRVGNWKYIEAPVPELYDLGQDPGELDNLAAGQPERAASLRSQLARMNPLDWMTAVNPLADVQTDEASRRRLASLGYASATGTRSASERVDPKVIARVQGRISVGDQALARGDAGAAERAYLEAMAIDDGNWKATWKLSDIYEKQGRFKEAEQLLRAFIERFPTNLAAHTALARVLVQDQDYAGALSTIDHVIAVNPDDAGAHSLRGVALYQLRRLDEARAAWEEALRRDPSDRLAKELLERTAPRDR